MSQTLFLKAIEMQTTLSSVEFDGLVLEKLKHEIIVDSPVEPQAFSSGITCVLEWEAPLVQQ